MNKFIKSGLIGLMAIAVVGTPVALHAQATNAPAKKAAKTPVNKTIPFRGNIKAIDNTAKTISVGNETFQITSETKIIKQGKPATLSDGVVGDPVAGSYHKEADGKLDAVSVRFGPKPTPAPSSTTKTNKP